MAPTMNQVHCHLHEKETLINILKDYKFSKSREVLVAERKNLVAKENKTVQMLQESYTCN